LKFDYLFGGFLLMDKNDLIKNLTDETFTKEIENNVVLVDFHAVWCGPCRMIAPVLEELAEHYKEKIKVVKVDIDTEQKTAATYEVTSVPTLILFKDGKEVNRLIGLRDSQSIKDIIDPAL
jgi:thioredoxin 1